MKRNTKTVIAGMIALAMSHAAMADDIKVAVVGAMLLCRYFMLPFGLFFVYLW